MWVDDSGPGLQKGREEAIFEKFERGARESAIPGVGLAGAKLAQLRGGSKGVGAGDADSGGDDSVVGDVDSGQAAQLGAAAATGGTSEAAMLGSEGGGFISVAGALRRNILRAK